MAATQATAREVDWPLDRHSLSWRLFGDRRVMLVAGRTLLLQVAHPVVGAGVAEHSTFRADPVRRLRRTLAFVNTLVYGSAAQAAAEGSRLRRMHESIRGTDELGRPYQALDPDAYHWVHATLVEGAVAMREHFGRALSADEKERLYAEWRRAGRAIGVDEGRMPADWEQFRSFFASVVDEQLEVNRSVRDVLETVTAGLPPSGPAVLHLAALAAGRVEGHVLHLVTAGTLPTVLRERFGLHWTPAHEAELTTVRAVVRAATVATPIPLRYRNGPRAAWQSAGWAGHCADVA